MVEKDFQFISTKLFIPSLRQSLVTRAQLLTRLDDSLQHSFTLICAPAGYGKTTLLSAWVRHLSGTQKRHPGFTFDKVTFSWVSLDQEDNDPVRLMGYIAASLEECQPGIRSEVQQLLGTFPPPSLPAVLTFLINVLSQASTQVVLILDDYQFISNSLVHEGITFFLEHAPENVHLILATRSDPPIPAARFRARGQLLEFRAGDLRFTTDETVQFLAQVMSISLSSENIAALDQRTEGWIAGLQMAALSMHGRQDINQFIEAFSGSHRYILDYLAEEVLNRQTPDVVDFLLRTSVLERMSAPLCEAVLEHGQSRGRDMLAYLDRANLFLISMDDNRNWYRYHHLFADLLRARLNEAHPGLAPQLHSRASIWYEQNGYLNDAVQHALVANDYERAVDIIDRHATIRWSQGDPSLIRMASRLPQQVLRTKPKSCVCWAWIQLARGDALSAFQLLDGLKDTILKDTSDESKWTAAFIDLLYAYESQETEVDKRPPIPDYHDLELIPDKETGLRDVADFLYANLLNRYGKFDQSAKLLECCTNRDINTIGPIAVFWGIALLARVWAMQGKLAETADLCRDYLKPRPGKPEGPFFSAGILNYFLGEVLYEWNMLDEAEEQHKQGLIKSEPWHNVSFEMLGYSNLTSVQIARGDTDGALETMRKLEELLEGRVLPPDLEEELFTVKVRVCLAKVDLATADKLVEKIAATKPKDYMQEWGYVSLGRVRLAQGRYREAQEVLEELINLPGAGQRVLRQIKSGVLLAVALYSQNKIDSAINTLENCLTLAEPGRMLRTFLDAGEPLRKLLSEYIQSSKGFHKAYAQQLLAAFPGAIRDATERVQHDMVEPLTPREREVLGLLAAGLSNRQIAEKLIVAEGTVKFYVHSVLEKLGVHSRTQAIAAARERNLI